MKFDGIDRINNRSIEQTIEQTIERKMSNITVTKEEIVQIDDKLNNKTVEVKKYTVIPDQSVLLQTDYNGNIYLRHDDKYYIVSLDQYCDSGVELTPINKPDYFRKNLLEKKKIEIRSGTIRVSDNTLRGRVYDSLNEMTEEEREEYAEKNNYSAYDPEFHERKYYWVQYKEDEPLDEFIEDEFYLNGVSSDRSDAGIVISDLLADGIGTFDTILIDGDQSSKHVISTIEKIDNSSTARLTVYSKSGYFRANFMNMSKYGRLCFDQDKKELIVVPQK